MTIRPRVAASAISAVLIVAGLMPSGVLAVDPPDASAAPVTTNEDTAKSVTLSATDPDGGNITSFDIQSGPSNGSLGSVSSIDCTPGPACTATVTYTPDADANGGDSFDFTATDEDDETSSAATASVTITPVNDAPSFTKGPDEQVDEDAGAQSEPGWASDISAGPADESGQDVSFQVTSNSNPSLFASGPAVSGGGSLTYTPEDDANGTATIGVRAVDDGGTAHGGDNSGAVLTFTIEINDVNDPPTFTAGSDQTDNEDASAQSVSGWATAIDEGAANESAQTVHFNVIALDTSLFSVQPAVSAGGTLTYTPAADEFGSTDVAVQAQDSGGTANGGSDESIPHVLTITLNAVNDPPTFTEGGDENVLEDAGAQSVPGWATSISNGPPNESSQTVTFDVTASDPTLFSVQPAVSSGGTLSYTPAADANGSTTVFVQAMDDGGTAHGGDNDSSIRSFTITIGDINDAPSFTGGGDVGAFEDAGAQTVTGWASNVSPGPADEAGQALQFTIEGNDNPSLFMASGQPAVSANGDLTFRPASNKNGVAHLSVNLADTGGTANGGSDTSGNQSFTIDVSGIDDPPIAANDLFTVRLTNPTALDVRANDLGGPSEQGDPTLITSVSGSARGYVTITGGGTGMTYDPFGCATGTDTLTYTLADAGGQTDTATVLVTISGPSSHPAADGPRPGFVSGSTIGSTTPVRLSWCGLTSGTSVKSYRIYQAKNGGSFKTLIKSTTSTSSTRSLDVSPDAYQFRTKITDKKGHTSTGTGPRFRVVRTQDTSGSIVYSTGWAKSTKGSPSGGSTHATSGTNKTATFTFTGRAFAIVATQAKKHGSFNVYVDGVKVTSSAISTRSTKTHERKVVYARSTTAGSHTIEIRTSGNGRVDLDAILSIAQP